MGNSNDGGPKEGAIYVAEVRELTRYEVRRYLGYGGEEDGDQYEVLCTIPADAVLDGMGRSDPGALGTALAEAGMVIQ